MVEVPSPSEQAEHMRRLFRVPFKAGDKANLVSLKWFQAWGDYTGFKSRGSGPFPGAVDNSDLMLDDNRMRPSLINHKDFEPISPESWKLLSQWYGGGPLIEVDMIEENKRIVPAVISGYVDVLFEEKRTNLGFLGSWTVKFLKEAACEKFKIECFGYRICFFESGEALDTSMTCSAAGLTHGVTLTLRRQSKPLPRPAMSHTSSQFQGMILGNSGAETGLVMMRRRPGIESVVKKGTAQDSVVRSVSHTGVAGHTPIRPIGQGICGLQNVGNTCYLNAALQCLMHAKPFVDYFLDETRPWRNDTSNGEIHPFVTIFASLLLDYWSGVYGVIAPRELKAAIGKKSSRFAGFGEQDSHELITFVLECLHEDLNSSRRPKEQIECIRGNGSDDIEISTRSLENFKIRDNSKIVDLFQGMLRSKMTCPKCKACVTVFEPYQTLSLPIMCDHKVDKSMFNVFIFVPFDPLKPKRQMRTEKFAGEPPDQAVARLGKSLGIENLHVACAGINSKGSIKWYETPRFGNSSDSSLWVFEIPDPSKLYAVVRLDGPKDIPIDGPYLVEINGPDTTKQEMEQIVNNYFYYLWDPAGKFDTRTITTSISKLKEKFKGIKTSGATGPKLQVNIKGASRLSKGKSLFKPCDALPFIAKKHVHARLNHAYTSAMHGFNWPRLQRQLQELIMPGGCYAEVSIEQCFEAFMKDAVLDEGNKWKCPNCEKLVCATKETKLWSTPPILIIHLKRFLQTMNGSRKIETNVTFPSEIDLEPFILESNPNRKKRYRLFAVDEHVGCINSGHYIARAFCENKKSWFRFSDSAVEVCTEQSAHSPNAYVLFYEKIDEPPEPTGEVPRVIEDATVVADLDLPDDDNTHVRPSDGLPRATAAPL